MNQKHLKMNSINMLDLIRQDTAEYLKEETDDIDDIIVSYPGCFRLHIPLVYPEYNDLLQNFLEQLINMLDTDNKIQKGE